MKSSSTEVKEKSIGNIQRLQIGDTDIILENFELGRGKIMITDPYWGGFTHYWGAMGSTLEEFLCVIDSDYFADKLCFDRYTFSAKETAKNIRRYIREELSLELPWYKHMEGQKELRRLLRTELINCSSSREALDFISEISNRLCYNIEDWYEDKEFREIIEGHLCKDSHFFLGEELSPQYNYLTNLHKNLSKYLSK